MDILDTAEIDRLLRGAESGAEEAGESIRAYARQLEVQSQMTASRRQDPIRESDQRAGDSGSLWLSAQSLGEEVETLNAEELIKELAAIAGKETLTEDEEFRSGKIALVLYQNKLHDLVSEAVRARTTLELLERLLPKFRSSRLAAQESRIVIFWLIREFGKLRELGGMGWSDPEKRDNPLLAGLSFEMIEPLFGALEAAAANSNKTGEALRAAEEAVKSLAMRLREEEIVKVMDRALALLDSGDISNGLRSVLGNVLADLAPFVYQADLNAVSRIVRASDRALRALPEIEEARESRASLADAYISAVTHLPSRDFRTEMWERMIDLFRNAAGESKPVQISLRQMAARLQTWVPSVQSARREDLIEAAQAALKNSRGMHSPESLRAVANLLAEALVRTQPEFADAGDSAVNSVAILLGDFFKETGGGEESLFARYGDLDEIRRILRTGSAVSIREGLVIYLVQLKMSAERAGKKPEEDEGDGENDEGPLWLAGPQSSSLGKLMEEIKAVNGEEKFHFHRVMRKFERLRDAAKNATPEEADAMIDLALSVLSRARLESGPEVTVLDWEGVGLSGGLLLKAAAEMVREDKRDGLYDRFWQEVINISGHEARDYAVRSALLSGLGGLFFRDSLVMRTNKYMGMRDSLFGLIDGFRAVESANRTRWTLSSFFYTFAAVADEAGLEEIWGRIWQTMNGVVGESEMANQARYALANAMRMTVQNGPAAADPRKVRQVLEFLDGLAGDSPNRSAAREAAADILKVMLLRSERVTIPDSYLPGRGPVREPFYFTDLRDLIALTSEDEREIPLFPKYGDWEELRRILRTGDENAIRASLADYRAQLLAGYARSAESLKGSGEDERPSGAMWLAAREGPDTGTGAQASSMGQNYGKMSFEQLQKAFSEVSGGKGQDHRARTAIVSSLRHRIMNEGEDQAAVIGRWIEEAYDRVEGRDEAADSARLSLAEASVQLAHYLPAREREAFLLRTEKRLLTVPGVSKRAHSTREALASALLPIAVHRDNELSRQLYFKFKQTLVSLTESSPENYSLMQVLAENLVLLLNILVALPEPAGAIEDYLGVLKRIRGLSKPAEGAREAVGTLLAHYYLYRPDAETSESLFVSRLTASEANLRAAMQSAIDSQEYGPLLAVLRSIFGRAPLREEDSSVFPDYGSLAAMDEIVRSEREQLMIPVSLPTDYVEKMRRRQNDGALDSLIEKLSAYGQSFSVAYDIRVQIDAMAKDDSKSDSRNPRNRAFDRIAEREGVPFGPERVSALMQAVREALANVTGDPLVKAEKRYLFGILMTMLAKRMAPEDAADLLEIMIEAYAVSQSSPAGIRLRNKAAYTGLLRDGILERWKLQFPETARLLDRQLSSELLKLLAIITEERESLILKHGDLAELNRILKTGGEASGGLARYAQQLQGIAERAAAKAVSVPGAEVPDDVPNAGDELWMAGGGSAASLGRDYPERIRVAEALARFKSLKGVDEPQGSLRFRIVQSLVDLSRQTETGDLGPMLGDVLEALDSYDEFSALGNRSRGGLSTVVKEIAGRVSSDELPVAANALMRAMQRTRLDSEAISNHPLASYAMIADALRPVIQRIEVAQLEGVENAILEALKDIRPDAAAKVQSANEIDRLRWALLEALRRSSGGEWQAPVGARTPDDAGKALSEFLEIWVERNREFRLLFSHYGDLAELRRILKADPARIPQAIGEYREQLLLEAAKEVPGGLSAPGAAKEGDADASLWMAQSAAPSASSVGRDLNQYQAMDPRDLIRELEGVAGVRQDAVNGRFYIDKVLKAKLPGLDEGAVRELVPVILEASERTPVQESNRKAAWDKVRAILWHSLGLVYPKMSAAEREEAARVVIRGLARVNVKGSHASSAVAEGGLLVRQVIQAQPQSRAEDYIQPLFEVLARIKGDYGTVNAIRREVTETFVAALLKLTGLAADKNLSDKIIAELSRNGGGKEEMAYFAEYGSVEELKRIFRAGSRSEVLDGLSSYVEQLRVDRERERQKGEPVTQSSMPDTDESSEADLWLESGNAPRAASAGEELTEPGIDVSAELAEVMPPRELADYLNAQTGSPEERISQAERMYREYFEKRFQALDRALEADADRVRAAIHALETTEAILQFLVSEDWDRELKGYFQASLDEGVIQPREIEGLAVSIRSRVLGMAVQTVDLADERLAEMIRDLDEGKLAVFESRLDGALAALQAGDRGRRLVLAINHPESDIEIVLGVLARFAPFIQRLEVLHEKSQPLKRAEWKAFPQLSTQLYDRLNLRGALEKVVKRGLGESPAFAFTADLGAEAIPQQFNTLMAEIGRLPSRRLQILAYTAALVVLIRLASLGDEEALAVRSSPEKLRRFIEDDDRTRFLADQFDLLEGTVRLNIQGFVASFLRAKEEAEAVGRAA
ncbi:MAG: hypothetical protein HY714_03965 [Candidatus Omnitrophica bacterium]|nr:hypothetical protein [Candidatus Omnitrophota bacterium]